METQDKIDAYFKRKGPFKEGMSVLRKSVL